MRQAYLCSCIGASTVVLLLMALQCATGAAPPCYPAIFVFGDSLSDTGNGPLSGNPLLQRPSMRPYGETFPGRPFGRFSDGRLIVDFLATALGLPFINPSLSSSSDFSRGINYAVSGATALNASFLETFLIFTVTQASLEVQLGRHLAFKASVASGGPGKPDLAAFAEGLYIVAIGENDYISALGRYTPSYVITTFVPLVIQKIRDVAETLLSSGARIFLFQTTKVFGCVPSVLANQLSAAKDSNGCVKDYNSVAYNHRVSLLNEVRSLRSAHPDAVFLFADYYGAYTYILQNNEIFGFSDTLDACCGAGPSTPYRYSLASFCNSRSTTTSDTLCNNPNTYLNWDGFHFTDKFNQAVTNQYISGSYLDPPNGLSSCASPVIA